MTRRVVVIGGGVIGLSVAYHCARAGFAVTVLERGPRSRDACSFGNAGMVVPSHFIPLAAPGMVALGLKWMLDPGAPFHVRPRPSWNLLAWAARFWRAANERHVRRCAPLLRDLHQASAELYAELEAGSAGFGLTRNGMLMLCRTDRALEEEAAVARQANELGIEARVLDAAGTAALDPGVRMAVAGSVYYPGDNHLTPQRLMPVLEAEAEALGVALRWESPVTGWRREGDRVAAVTTPAGEVAADEFVLCGGVWSQGLARGLGLRIPLEAGKGYNLTIERPPVLPRICAVLAEARMAVTPMDGAMRFGGTMELSGIDPSISKVRIQRMIDAAVAYYPDFTPADFDGVRPWSGLRPCSPDGMPYIGRTRAYANLSLACGHAMMGVSLAPVTGRIVADALRGAPLGWDLAPVSPDRYA